MKVKTLLILILISCHIAYGQADEENNQFLWTSVSFNKKINKKARFNYSQLHSIGSNDLDLKYVQFNFKFSYKLKKRITLSLGYKPSLSVENETLRNRLYAGVRMYSKLGDKIRMNNSLSLEYYFTQRAKFQNRYFYKLKVYYRNNQLPWRLRPFVSQRIFWYSNGRLLQYYDEKGNKTNLKPPKGIHAYRFKAGLKFYPVKKVAFTIFYLKQIEFNTRILGSRDINAINPNTDKVRRPFYDFSVYGVSISYTL